MHGKLGSRLFFVIVLLAFALGRTESAAAATVFDPANVILEPVTAGLSQPVFLTNAGDGSGRLFVLERAGKIRIIKNGVLQATPFLDIHTSVNSTGSEQGLLALAFHPNYAGSGRFYVAFTDSSGSLHLSRFQRSSGNADQADPNSRLDILTVPHPTYQNHNGGTLAFGPDGYLYWTTGDGGSGGDPSNNAQNLNVLLGKVLRIDIDHTDPGLQYSIPSTNPFFQSANARGEIWAYGLRNPYRVSFDRQTGDLWIADVGQSQREEIDFQPASSTGGQNYGWRIYEGSLCYNPSPAATCDPSGKTFPIIEYNHTVGCSITGGYRYRGSQFTPMQGYYFYGDYCTGVLFALNGDPVSGWSTRLVQDTAYNISTFGEDEQGELYLADYGAGSIYHVAYVVRLPSSWYGSLSISSNRAVVGVARPHIGAEIASYNGFASGGPSWYLPMLFKGAFDGSYDSAFYIQNTDASHTAHVTVEYRDTSGNLTCGPLADTVPPLSSRGYWVPSVSCVPAGWVGGAVVRSSDYPIAVVARPHVGAEVMTYDGFASGGLSSYLPMLFKHAFGGSYDSAFYVQNVDPSNDAQLTIQYFDSAGNFTCSRDDSIQPLSSHGYWVPNESCLPTGWVGSAVITSNHAIVAIARPHIGAQITTYDGFTSGGMRSYVPMLFKHAFGGSYDAAFYIQNVSSVGNAHVAIDYYDSDGNLSCSQNDVITPQSSHGYWVPSVSCLPVGWVGGAVVSSSDYPIVAVGRPHIGAQVTTYDGFADGGLALSMPMLFKNMWGSYNSALYIQNTDAGGPAAVTLKFYDVDGNLSCTRSDTIPALATLGYWVPSVECAP